MADPTQLYPIFSGRARHALDAKNRTTIPVGWRPEKPTPLWIVPQSDSSCLLAMPEAEFRAVPARVNALTHLDAEERQDFIDIFMSEAEQVTPDGQGRFVIPPRFCEKLGLRGEVVLSGADAKFKIWKPEDFEQFLTDRLSRARTVGKQAQV
jgi:MraZ protein